MNRQNTWPEFGLSGAAVTSNRTVSIEDCHWTFSGREALGSLMLRNEWLSLDFQMSADALVNKQALEANGQLLKGAWLEFGAGGWAGLVKGNESYPPHTHKPPQLSCHWLPCSPPPPNTPLALLMLMTAVLVIFGAFFRWRPGTNPCINWHTQRETEEIMNLVHFKLTSFALITGLMDIFFYPMLEPLYSTTPLKHFWAWREAIEYIWRW